MSKLPKNPHWAIKAVVEPYPEDRHYGTFIMMPSTTKTQFYQNNKNQKGF